jgi:transposase
VPIWHRAFDGRAGEVNQVVHAMSALRSMCGQRSFLIVGDSKLVSFDNLRQMIAAGVRFIAPASKTYIAAEVLAGCDWHAAAPVDYVADRDAAKPAQRRGSYRVLEDTWTMPPPSRSRHAGLPLRRVFVWSSADAEAAAAARSKKLDRARTDLDALARGLGGRHYATAEQVRARLTTIAAKRRVGAYLRTEVGVDRAGKPTLDWRLDPAVLQAEAATDGWYCLLTNLDPPDADAGQVLARYKGQEVVERRYGTFKGPLAVAPVFLKSNRRIEALLSVICLALLIFCLIERQARRAIAPDTKIAGLGGYRDARPTGANVLEALAELPLIPAHAHAPPTVPEPTGLQARLLDLLDVDPLTIR